MFPFTADDVVNAFEQTGLGPNPDYWYCVEENCACGLGALYIFLNGRPNIWGLHLSFIQKLGLKADHIDLFSKGFEDGFNDKSKRSYLELFDPYEVGYEAGQRMRVKQAVAV